MKNLLDHFGQSQHFKNLVYFLMMLTLCLMLWYAKAIPDKFWNIILLVTGYYFGSNGNIKLNKDKDKDKAPHEIH